ncbi:MAG: endonuclease/exonuclease/phosphatase family protein [Candidatus Moranbacteria bacterium]|nr:endonuclease/exonuclease/phosphatase family protein [Candidatus Moranbacteria bacterium]
MKIKIININLWQTGNLQENAFDFLKKEDADIVLLQEVRNGKGDGLERQFKPLDIMLLELKYPYFDYAPTFLENMKVRKIEEGNVILSKFPIKSSRAIFYDVPYGERNGSSVEDFTFTPRNLQCAEIDLGDESLNVYNTQGIWGTDGEDNERRLQMGEVIANEVSNKTSVVLAGDFNVKENTETIKKIERNLVNVFKGELKNSFNMRVKKGPEFAIAVVDMFFASSNLKVVEHSCPDIDVSDHLPLIVTLDI